MVMSQPTIQLMDVAQEVTFIIVHDEALKPLSISLAFVVIDDDGSSGAMPALWRNRDNTGWYFKGDLPLVYDDVNEDDTWEIELSDEEIEASKLQDPVQPFRRMYLEYASYDVTEPRFLLAAVGDE